MPRPIGLSAIRDLGKTEWLSDEHIDAGLHLLRQLDESVDGLFNVDTGLKLYPKIKALRWCQILHNGRSDGGHWLLAASGFVGKGDSESHEHSVKVFDSLFFIEPN